MDKVNLPMAKRVFDVVVSFVALLILSPVVLLIVITMFLEMMVKADSSGKVFYKETRISQGEAFTLYKFRIFKESKLNGAKDSNGFVHTKDLEKDERNLTWTGRILKRIYMDELPQLINVLKGDMSLVGPRPTNMVNFKKRFAQGKRAKYLLRAGITGYFQSHKGRKMKLDQEELDMIYAGYCKNKPGWWVLLYDIKILLITMYTVLRAEGI